MSFYGLNLPLREKKLRKYGITILIDNGLPFQLFKDTIISSSDLIDFVKFGWGTSIVTKQLIEKINCLRENNIEFFFGGTLFEKFLSQGKIDDYYNYCKEFGCKYIEISNGTIDLTNREKSKYISNLSSDFFIFSEVGRKNSQQSDDQCSSLWLEYIQEDLEAGAQKVITEARESGTSGVCYGNGEIRIDIIEEIISSNVDIHNIVFEAPTKSLQTLFIKKIGANVNLANISFNDTIPLETLRLGLRSDTFYLVELEREKIHEGH